MDDMEQALRDMRALLGSYGLTAYVEFVDEALQLYSAGEDEPFREALLSNDFWGGAGSVRDIHLPSLRLPGRDAWQDQKSLHLAIIHFAEALEGRGLADHRVLSTAGVFRKWRDDGVYEHPPGRVSKVELAAHLDPLVFPGSELLQEESYDAGEGWGFDGTMLTPMVTRRYATESDPHRVRQWYDSQLTENGWRRTLTKSMLDMYERGTETFTLRLWGKPATLSETGEWLDVPDKRFWYDIYLEEVAHRT